MNEDLIAIQEEIDRRKAEQPVVVQTETAKSLVDKAFNQAIVNRVVENETVQADLLESADTVIKNKLNAIKSQAETEDKEAHFNNKKGACECFGYNETTTEKWAVNVMNIWHNAMTFLWIVIGFFTFAPITFISKKISVIFKKAWLAVLLAIIIYLAMTVLPLVFTNVIDFNAMKGGT